MRVKTAPARVKLGAADDDKSKEGQFTALVSVFGTVDSVNDVVMPGAFAKTLAGFAESGAPIPIVWSHDWSDPFSHIGYSTSARETDDGLEVTGQLDLDNPKAAQVYRLLKGGRCRDFSFAYEVNDSVAGERDGKSVIELRDLTIFEVGPTLIGAHRSTELRDIKSGEHVGEHIAATQPDPPAEPVATKAGRVLSAKNEDRIAQIAALAQELLASVQEVSQPDDGKAMPAQSAATEEPQVAPAVKVDEPARHGAASRRLRTDLDLFEAEVDSLST